MKLLINLTLSLIIALLPAFSAANACCCMDLLPQNISQTQPNSVQKSCHEQMQKSDQHKHLKCHCDHHATNSIPSITTTNTSFQLKTSTVFVSTITPLLSHSLDNIYRPPISA